MFGRCTASVCLMGLGECIGSSWLRRPVVVAVAEREFKLCSAVTLAELASHGARRATCLLQLQLHAH